MPKAPRNLDELGRIQCPRCSEWNYLSSHTKDKKRTHGAGTYCLKCIAELMRTRYGYKAKYQREIERIADARAELQGYQPELWGPAEESLDDPTITEEDLRKIISGS